MLNFDVLDRKRVYVQLLELCPISNLFLKQSVKAHGPLVLSLEAPIVLGDPIVLVNLGSLS